MEWTGERFIPGQGSAELAYEHFSRYLFARRLAVGRRVLDVGSGEGYGAFLMAQVAQSVVGCDNADDAVAHARQRYVRANLTFVQASAAALPADRPVGLVTCFEVIEHLTEADQHTLLANISQALDEDGICLVSTPNLPVYHAAGGPGYVNPYHLREMTFAQFDILLSPYFDSIVWYGQQLAVGSYLSRMVGGTEMTTETDIVRLAGNELTPRLPHSLDAKYFIAVCAKSRAALDAVPLLPNFVVLDSASSIETEWRAVGQWATALKAELETARDRQATTDSQLAEAHHHLDTLQARLSEAETRLPEAQQMVATLQDRLTDTEQRLTEREQAIQSLQAQLSETEQRIAEREQVVQSLQAQLSRTEKRLVDSQQMVQTLQSRLSDADRQAEAVRGQLADKDRSIETFSLELHEAAVELSHIHASRWWRLASVYWRWRARLRGDRAAPGATGGSQGQTAALVSVPSLPAPTENSGIAARGAEVILPRGTGPDVFCFPIINWEFRFQRPQQLMTQWARIGRRIFYFRTEMAGLAQREVMCNALSERIYELRLPGDQQLGIYRDELTGVSLELMRQALDEFIRRQDIAEAVCVVQYPFWEPLARYLRERYGWQVVYDCMDEHAGFGTHGPTTLSTEQRLLRESDLVVVSAQRLREKAQSLTDRWALIPNAGDYDHFSRLPERSTSPLAHLPRPVIGYYGAIAEWFDTEAIRAAAAAHPDWTFALIGHTFGADLGDLPTRANVRLLGEKPYADLPAYLTAFDVCVIPFRRTPLTEATNPVKVFEYLAAGKPVVAQALPELESLSDVIYQYTEPEEFVAQLERALTDRSAAAVQERQAIARQNTWQQRRALLDDYIGALYDKVSIVIVSYNGLEHTRACLTSILDHTEYPNYEIIVVDNASDAPVQDYLRELAARDERVHVICNGSNLGFAVANNIGLAQAQGDFLVLLNNDTVVPPGWLSRLLRYARRRDVGLVGPVTNWTGNEARIDVTYQDVADMPAFARRWCATHIDRHFDIPVLAMYCVAMRREIYERVGSLDDRFGLGMFEDDDYAHRVREAGYRVICTEDVFVHHVGRAAFSRLDQAEYDTLFERNKRLFEAKWGRPWTPHTYRASLVSV